MNKFSRSKNSFGYSFTKKQEPQLKKYDFKQQAFLGVEATQGREDNQTVVPLEKTVFILSIINITKDLSNEKKVLRL